MSRKLDPKRTALVVIDVQEAFRKAVPGFDQVARATAALVRGAEATAAGRRGEPLRYARALQRGRLRLRQTARWSAPFYWAPFVLIGPPD